MKIKEKIIEILLKLCASITIFTTIGIIAVLLFESIAFFKNVSIFEFFTDTQWTPLFSEKHFGILSLVSGTFLTAAIAIA
ncbi:MAG: phosphate ABC transporter permease subunit PstC, partial [Flavobacteriaceae bacterium]|nr:phosphate ABC transporter permease subunit PstC [Flavobacteriaceae bacterium]